MLTPNDPKIRKFAALIFDHMTARLQGEGHFGPPKVMVSAGRKWIRVDVDDSGKYLIDATGDGSIIGIKGYGVPHYGKQYGTLDTIDEFDWSGYTAFRLGRVVPVIP